MHLHLFQMFYNKAVGFLTVKTVANDFAHATTQHFTYSPILRGAVDFWSKGSCADTSSTEPTSRT